MLRKLFTGLAETALPAADLWALALSAPYCRQAGGPYDCLTPYRGLGTRVSRALLREYWGVNGASGREQHEQTLAALCWLRDAGHRRDFAEPGDIEAALDFLAWDAARIVHVARHAYHAGYLDTAEAWVYVRVLAPLVQKTFPSWAEYGRRFGRGRLRWLTERDPSFDSAIAWLSSAPDSPWQNLRWDTPLPPALAGPEDSTS
ncbi:MAG TPA: DUF1266 domain-containing protein [Stellaceae bacterium]|nr:DUF1266 domain-containing protein [Stellaceae bacterium]